MLWRRAITSPRRVTLPQSPAGYSALPGGLLHSHTRLEPLAVYSQQVREIAKLPGGLARRVL